MIKWLSYRLFTIFLSFFEKKIEKKRNKNTRKLDEDERKARDQQQQQQQTGKTNF